MTNNPARQALDDEFNAPDSTMHVETYFARQKEIRARGLTPAAPDLAAGKQFVTQDKFAESITLTAKAIDATIRLASDPNREKYITRDRLEKVLGIIATAVKAKIDRACAPINPLASRLATLETRCAALAMMIAKSPEAQATVSELEAMIGRVKSLEARPAIQYRGVWHDGQEHTPSSFVTHDGSLWHCNATTRAKPGTGADWTLAAKKGRDAPR